MLRSFSFLRILFLVLSVCITSAATAKENDKIDTHIKPLEITRITPSGDDSAANRQIVIEFNRPVVPLGKMDRTQEELGITLTPPLNCDWRWMNISALSCQLDEKNAMTAATQYTLTIKPKITAEDGAILRETVTHTFGTALPRLENAYLDVWQDPQTPRYRLQFNQPVFENSVKNSVLFYGGGEEFEPLVTIEKEHPEKSIIKDGQTARMNWLITPSRALIDDSEITLGVKEGLQSVSGSLTGKAQEKFATFYTFPAPDIAGITCLDKDGNSITIKKDDTAKDIAPCNPLAPISLLFTTPVLRSAVKDSLTITPKLGSAPDAKPWGEENRDWSRLGETREARDRTYPIFLPSGLKAATEYTLSLSAPALTLWQRIKAFLGFAPKSHPTTLKDEFGRSLPPFSMTFATGHRNPNYELLYRDIVLEKNIDSQPPLFVNNLENYAFDFITLTTTGFLQNQKISTELPAIKDIQFAVPLDIRGMLKNKSGVLYGNLKTTPDVNKWDGAGRILAQVTPFAVHAKLGHFQSALYVADLSTGKPVADANIMLYRGAIATLKAEGAALGAFKTDENGMAFLPGLEKIDPTLGMLRTWKDEDARLMIRVQKGDDMALLPISYEYEVPLWNIASNVYTASNEKYGHMNAWGMTAQGIYRTGDTIQYKIFIRDQDNQKYITPDNALAYDLTITDPAGKIVNTVENIALSSFGTLHGEYALPKTAVMGWYSFKVNAYNPSDKSKIIREFYPLSVLVTDFTTSPFRVTTELNGDQFESGQSIDIQTQAALHSGGGYNDAPTRVNITLKARTFSSNNPVAENFYFDSFEGEQDTQTIFEKEQKTDKSGFVKISHTLTDAKIAYGQLVIEGSVKDDRGKSVASTARAEYHGVDRYVGLKPTRWVYDATKQADVKILVVSPDGKLQSGTKISLTFEKQIVDVAKVKSAGSAYLDDKTITWEKIEQCDTVSNDEAVSCGFIPQSAGTYRAIANIADTKGRKHQTKLTLWVAGSDYVQWEDETASNALTLLPEKTDYKVGDTAKFLVKNPYPGATAYISVERYGVMDHFTQILKDSTPIIEIPIKADYLPGVYISVLIISPRVDAPPPELGQVDMGKPAYRIGYFKLPIDDPYKRLTIDVKTPQDTYRPRDIITADISIKPTQDMVQPQPTELAIAVLDESVFDLLAAGEKAYDPYHGFYNLDSLDVVNYSLMSRLVGRQKFEKKGANAGGDGGGDSGARDLFKFISYWNPAVPVDDAGNAKIEFEAPDNLTGWRILALAVTKDDQMGLGQSTFKVNRPTEIRPAIANIARDGDTLNAGFTVMNRTDSARTLSVHISASGAIKGGTQTKTEKIMLEPFTRSMITLPLIIEQRENSDTINFTIDAGDEIDRDMLAHTLPVWDSKTFETATQFDTSTDPTLERSIAVPKNIHENSASLTFTLSPTILSGLDGAFAYMKNYPHNCWEQKLSKAVMAAHYETLKPFMNTQWDEAKKLSQDVLNMAADYQAPNGGMAYFKANDEYVDPYLSAYTALSFTWLKDDGYEIPQNVEKNLHTYLKNLLQNKAAPEFYSNGMVETTRAIILATLSNSKSIPPHDITRFEDKIPAMSLAGKSMMAAAAQNFESTKNLASKIRINIESMGVESAGKLSFSQKIDEGFERILTTDLRDQCITLDMLLQGDISGEKAFKIVRSIIASRGNNAHFENTQENVFCMRALTHYAQKFESIKPDMQIKVSLESDEIGNTIFKDFKDVPVTFKKESLISETKQKLKVQKDGDGRYYAQTLLRTAPLNPKPTNAGFEIKRQFSIRKNGKWEPVNSSVTLTRGDIVRVDLFVSTPTARNFVAVLDPLPSGLETINQNVATASSVDATSTMLDDSSFWFSKPEWFHFGTGRWNFYHQELRHDSARFYADWLDAGNHHLSYTAQAIATGTFYAPPPMVEEMYDPDIFGRGEQTQFIIHDSVK